MSRLHFTSGSRSTCPNFGWATRRLFMFTGFLLVALSQLLVIANSSGLIQQCTPAAVAVASPEFAFLCESRDGDRGTSSLTDPLVALYAPTCVHDSIETEVLHGKRATRAPAIAAAPAFHAQFLQTTQSCCGLHNLTNAVPLTQATRISLHLRL